MNFRSRRFRLLLIGILIGAPVLVCLLNFYHREPSFQGRRLSEWVEIYANYRGKEPLPPRIETAALAIRTIGTNGLPYLLSSIQYEPAAWRYKAGKLARLLPLSVTGGDPVRRLTIDSAGEKRAEFAMEAFRVLGLIASPALPELTKLVQQTNSIDTSDRALFALCTIGPSALPVLTNAFASPRYAGNPWSTICMRYMGTNARAVTPVVVDLLTNTNPVIAAKAERALGMFPNAPDLEPKQVIPSLTQCLTNSNDKVRIEAPSALMAFESRAIPALPALTNALNDVNPDVRTKAAKAIKVITSFIHE